MFYVVFTPKTAPAQAMSAQAPKLMTAFSKLLADLDLAFDAMDEWFVARILEASKEATDNMENGDEASGSWSDMGCEDDAFSIDIFNADDVRIVTLDGDELLAPHGAVALAIGEFNHQEWIYDEDEVSQWDNVLRPAKPSIDWKGLDAAIELSIETCEHTGMIRDELESICGTPAQPLYVTIDSHNAPLYAAMIACGCEWKSEGNYEHFTKDGEYEDYPIGYIRGPHSTSPGNPNRYQYSVQGPSGWHQQAFKSLADGQRWALATAASMLAKA